MNRYSEFHGTNEQRSKIDIEIQAMIKNRVIEETPYKKLKWLNPIHLVPRPHSDKVRLVVDKRKTNQLSTKRHFKMEGIPTLKDPIARKDYAISFYLYLRRLLNKADKIGVTLTAVHIPGVENTVTDSLSCLELSGDYQIKKALLWPALKKLNFRPNVNLFARTSNALLRTFCSLKSAKAKRKRKENDALAKKPESIRLGNAFQIKCSKMNPIIHHPIPLIMKSLRKFEEEGEHAVLIVPDWKGQPWSPLLKS
jgi:hypothetical protein